MTTTSWLVCPTPIARPRARLICFPYAGGAASAFHGWRVGPGVEVSALALPGRTFRIREPPLREMGALVDAICAELARLDGPLVFYGHSMGSLVAWEVAHRVPNVIGLAVGARGAPDAPVGAALTALDDRGLIAALARIYGADVSAFDDPELAELALPALRADFTVLERWQLVPRPPLSIGLLALAGARDLAAPPAAVAGWRAFTTGRFETDQLAAGHFFLETHRAEVQARLAAWVAALTS